MDKENSSFTSGALLRILSWNVNGIRAMEKRGFTDWLSEESPDILCIQETKAEAGQLSEALKSPVNKNGVQYTSFWAGAKKKGYSGVAIYTTKEPLEVKNLGISDFDDEGRVLQADFGDFIMISAYFPNSQGEGLRLDYKLAFCGEILTLCKEHIKNGRHIILAGDYNIAHKAIDLAHPKANEGNAGYLPEERAWMDTWTSSGFTDSFRYFSPDLAEQYSWWSYRMKAREKNVGWRLDYHCVDNAFLPAVRKSIIRQDITGSDHCPVEIEISLP
ncbi:MAG: exodeoxyribonuclease III [Spirochaetaceae bacterium]|jgi:exodeoxyribonuclease-3|nr:exodeoxyribonuclease III [Spirochaetaceae bacterium]